MGFSNEEKLNILKIYYRCNNILHEARNTYIREFPNYPAPCKATILNIVKQFEERKTVARKKRHVERDNELDLQVLLYFEGICSIWVIIRSIYFLNVYFYRKPRKVYSGCSFIFW